MCRVLHLQLPTNYQNKFIKEKYDKAAFQTFDTYKIRTNNAEEDYNNGKTSFFCVIGQNFLREEK